MNDRRFQRQANPAVVLVPRRAIALAVVAVAIVALVFGIVVTGALARATTASAIADGTEVSVQKAAVERDVERAYELNLEQVQKVRALKLPIGVQQADSIASKAVADLKTLRHSAFVSLGQTFGGSAGDVESYAAGLEQRYDAKPVAADPSAAPVLLAPRLYAVVTRMNELARQISDKATRDMTQPVVPSASPTSLPTGSARLSASPSPTR